MLPYLEIHNQHVILLVVFGALGLAWLVFAAYSKVLSIGRSEPKEEEWERFPGGVREGRGKIPLFLILLYIGLSIWAVIYVLAHAFWGMEFNG